MNTDQDPDTLTKVILFRSVRPIKILKSYLTIDHDLPPPPALSSQIVIHNRPKIYFLLSHVTWGTDSAKQNNGRIIDTLSRLKPSISLRKTHHRMSKPLWFNDDNVSSPWSQPETVTASSYCQRRCERIF
jgi:hypothetical protein